MIALPYKCPEDVKSILAQSPNVMVASTVNELVELSCRSSVNGWHEVAYDIPGKGRVVEARVCKVRNGVAANYLEPYMRRRDPECMLIGDELPTNKPRFSDRIGVEFESVRAATFAWLETQELALFHFIAGIPGKGTDAIVVGPSNAGFFALTFL